MNPFTSHLEKIVGDRLRFDEPLSSLSHYNVGGPARYLADATTTDEVRALVQAANEHDISWVILGGGTNILPSDEGFDGLVIRMANRSMQMDMANARVTVEAGALASMVARKTADAGLSGFSGQSVCPERSAAPCEEMPAVLAAKQKTYFCTPTFLIQNREGCRAQKAWFEFGYRESRVKHEPWVVLRATFQLETRSVEETKEKVNEVLRCRLTTQPKNAKCAGCVFKNFEYDSDDDIAQLHDEVADIPPKFLEQKRIPAGWLIDRAELKGTRVGGAYISQEHGNFLINDGSATADHIAQLIAVVKTRIRDHFGIQLQEEVQYIG